jgi:hypothetical protein
LVSADGPDAEACVREGADQVPAVASGGPLVYNSLMPHLYDGEYRHTKGPRMIEVQRLEAKNLAWMLELLRGVASERKLRLFAVGCCRRVWSLLADKRSRTAVEVAERYADGLCSESERADAYLKAVLAAVEMRTEVGDLNAPAWAATMAQATAANAASLTSVSPFSLSAADLSGRVIAAGWCGIEAADRRALRETPGSLLGHIMVSPLCSSPNVPSVVRNLADVVYQQEAEVIGPLHDALLDAGLPDLAEHFSNSAEWHPKGCWAVDLLTGRG